LEKGKSVNADELISEINTECEKMNAYVYIEASAILADGKIPALIGGDHSTPLGLIKALGEKHGRIWHFTN
jgi:agmatinase